MQIFKNFFQLSTLRALLVVLSAVGLKTAEAEPLLEAASVVGLTVYGTWETFRNSKKGG